MSEIKQYFLQPGFIYVSKENYLINTVLGSCISVCIWDCKLNFGGMNHYIYSRDKHGERNAKFGDVSIPYLIKLMRDYGAEIENLRAHVVGGGFNPELGCKIGNENSEIALEILKAYNIIVVTKDLGEATGRKVIFNNFNGEILVYKGISVRRSDWFNDNTK